MLTREQILSAPTRPVVQVQCPDLGGPVCLRQLSGAEMAALYANERDNQAITQDLVASSLCDSEGNRLMTQPGDGAALYAAHPAHALKPIVDEALRINRMTKEAVDDARKA
jgi:hypothetical protein